MPDLRAAASIKCDRIDRVGQLRMTAVACPGGGRSASERRTMARLLWKVLVVRNDRLGDLMLAYPTFLLLKQALPQTLIHALVPGYTSEMARCCRGVDSVLLDPGPHARQYEQMELLRQLRKERYDAILSLYSTLRVGALAFLARIPYRLPPATKLAQLFYNKRLVQRRSRSAKP